MWSARGCVSTMTRNVKRSSSRTKRPAKWGWPAYPFSFSAASLRCRGRKSPRFWRAHSSRPPRNSFRDGFQGHAPVPFDRRGPLLPRHTSCFTLGVLFPIRSNLSMPEAQAMVKAAQSSPAMSDAGPAKGVRTGELVTPSAPLRRLSILERLATAAVPPDDSEELRLRKSILVVASVATGLATLLWLGIYRMMGLTLPSTIPFVYLLLTVLFLSVYLKTRNFDFYRMTQLALFLFAPFVIQWSIGSFVNSSGIVLLALLAPVGAMVVYGPRESIPWFAAYVVLTILSGLFDYYLADGNLSGVPMRTVAVFFVLNFTILSSIVYLLLRYFVMRKDIFQAKLSQAHAQVLAEQERSEQLLNTILQPHIAKRLKQEETISDGFADVTVMFADIVNFTALAEQHAAKEVVRFLDGVFNRFDRLADKHGVDKIKTIGDAYMVAGG